MAPLADALLAVLPANVLPYYLKQYTPPLTPLSSTPVVVGALAGYLSVIFGVQELMRTRQPLKLQFLFQLHNVLLSSGSALLLALMVEEIFPIWRKHGLFYAICGEGAWTSRLEFYYMINYYFKYWELVDTVFLALKKKPLAFLHVFHHAATAFLCFTQLNGKTSVSWVVITLNLAVHVVMYYYYYATAGGRRFWWKKYLTTMQIVQFVIDLFVVYFASYSYFIATYLPSAPHVGTCSGGEGAALFGCLILTTYLFLFISFYRQTYKAGAGARKSAQAAANKVANGSGPATANGNGNGVAKH